MDAQKRNKLLVAVLAVVGLGAGSFWYLSGDSGGPKTAAVNEGPVERKQRVVTDEAKTTRKAKDPKAAPRAEPTTIERKEREAPEEATIERKKRREDKTKEKKKTIAPAA